jgi:large subunit ribosomal protein L25
MSDLLLAAERRTLLGKSVKNLRRNGRVPGIVYGPVVSETVPVSVDRREFERFYRTNGYSTLFTLRWGDGEASVFIREVQSDAVQQAPLHVDFYAPNLQKELTANVPLVFHHAHPKAGGIVTHVHNEVAVSGLPSAIPHQVDVNLSNLVDAGDALHATDLVLPPGISLVTPADAVIAHVEAIRVEVVPEVEVVEEPEAAALEEAAPEATTEESES